MSGIPEVLLNQITIGDSHEGMRLLAEESVDLILTDPPYLREHINAGIYRWLAQEAARVLKPGGFCLAYTGGQWVAEVLEQMQASLTFFWLCILRHGGNASGYVYHRRAIVRYTPIVVFVKGKGRPCKSFLDCTAGAGADKRYHIWGQDERTASYYLECFSRPGDLIVDPFCGGGTVPFVCKQMGRPFVAFEIDPTTAEIARKRVAQVQLRLPGLMVEQQALDMVTEERTR